MRKPKRCFVLNTASIFDSFSTLHLLVEKNGDLTGCPFVDAFPMVEKTTQHVHTNAKKFAKTKQFQISVPRSITIVCAIGNAPENAALLVGFENTLRVQSLRLCSLSIKIPVERKKKPVVVVVIRFVDGERLLVVKRRQKKFRKTKQFQISTPRLFAMVRTIGNVAENADLLFGFETTLRIQSLGFCSFSFCRKVVLPVAKFSMLNA